VIERAAEITSRHGHAHVDAVRQLGPVSYLRTVVDELIASQLVWNCLTAKSIRYANEREVRYLVLNLRGKFDAYRKTFGEAVYRSEAPAEGARKPYRDPGGTARSGRR
jgi:hypothetical protein